MRYGMVVDLDRCIGCWACATACKLENSVGEGIWWQMVHVVDVEVGLPTSYRDVDQPLPSAAAERSLGQHGLSFKHFQPSQCFHCADAPCVTACPTNAIVQRDDGIVRIEAAACIGCRDCEPACPYGMISFNAVEPVLPHGLDTGHGDPAVAVRVAGIVEKCTFCDHRVDRGDEPACVEVCPTHVFAFGDLDDPDSAVAAARRSSGAEQPLAELGADPSVWYLPYTKAARQRRSLADDVLSLD